MEALTKFGEEIGTVFQLADDIIDIASDSKESGKTPGTDLREGVPTLVTLFILESNDPADAELKKILSAPITDEAVVAQTILTLRNHSALTKSRELVAGYGRSAQKHLEILSEIAELLSDTQLREKLKSPLEAIELHQIIATWTSVQTA